jgi:hypothetical protein
MLTTGEKMNIIQEVERNPAVSQNEIAKCSVLPLSTLTQLHGKLQFLKRKVWEGNILEK